MRKTMRQMHDAKREEALAAVQAKVDDGSLTIRQMTAEERVRYGCDDAVRFPPTPG